jgi:hypothetical protein
MFLHVATVIRANKCLAVQTVFERLLALVVSCHYCTEPKQTRRDPVGYTELDTGRLEFR